MNKAFENAARYAEEFGWQVFPCAEGDKVPLTLHGFKDATDDPTQLQEWNRQWPNANWAVATGSVSGIYVIDPDDDDANAWFDSLWLPLGLVVTTPRGGRHIYYAYDGNGIELRNTKGKLHPHLDTRGDGGYVLLPGSKTSSKVRASNGDGEYVGDLDVSLMPDVPQAWIDQIPESQHYETLSDEEFAELQEVEKPENISPQEERVLKGLIDLMQSLPQPWHPGAGWHSTGFFVACSLWRIVNSPEYATGEAEAHRMYLESAPIHPDDPDDIWDVRWESARKQVGNQIAESPGDVPVRLEAQPIVDRLKDSRIDRLFWESKKVKDVRDLIHELRLAGATQQEAYSVSYESAAMKRFRRSGDGKSTSTWGFVTREWETAAHLEESESSPRNLEVEGGAWTPEKAESTQSRNGVPLTLLTEPERDSIRNYPNFIDFYVEAAKEIFSEPNLPLHYVNAWVALGMGVGDLGRLYYESGDKPVTLWGLCAAPSASGKTDAFRFMGSVVDAVSAEGLASIDLGDDVSAEALIEAVVDRPGAPTAMLVDEAAEILTGFHQVNSYYHKVRGAILKLYDGKASRALRKGMDKNDIGQSVDASFTSWLQAPTERILESLNEDDLASGFVGRYLVANGDKVKVTRDSLRPRFASEYQVQSGKNPLVESFTSATRAFRFEMQRGAAMGFATESVAERHLDAAQDIVAYAEKHPLSEHLVGIMIRLSENILKGAALLALSEGRTLIEMEDYLLALKSGEHWVKSMVWLVDGISMSEYRQLVEYVADAVASRPRTQKQLLTLPRLKDVKMFEVNEIIERAEREGKIVKREGSHYWEAPDE